MIGTVLNVAGIVAGGITGLLRRRGLTAANESFFKVVLGAFTVFFGLRLTWASLNGPFLVILKQLAVTVLALILGRLLGRLLRLQKLSNRIGRFAGERISSVRPSDPRRLPEGFKTCAMLFCAAPLGIVGAVLDGLPFPGNGSGAGPVGPAWLSGYSHPLLIKAVMEGLATMGFVRIFGWGVILSALPVLVWQGTITLGCALLLEPWLRSHGLLASLQAVGGLLVFCVALVILELKKIELADYLPSLVVAPLIALIWK
jgi:uncharacterized membrane protein YqgA involved in biofilm formation